MKKALLALSVISMSLLTGCGFGGLGGLWGEFASLLRVFNVRGIW
jgi:hypothetical protein